MKRTKGFTLTELLTVVSIIALLVVVLVVFLSRGSMTICNGLPKLSLCAANLNGVGKGIVLYQIENDDATPWIASDDWSSATGTNAMSLTQPTKVSPTALMFLLVRSGQPADLFRCPSDSDVTKMATTRFTSGGASYYYWDFYDAELTNPTAADHCKKVSYSFQAPLYDSASSSYSPGYKANSRGDLAIMADKTPGFDGKTPCTNWSSDLGDKQRRAGISQNHTSDDSINVLYADAHVAGGERADVGVGDDNIYSASNDINAGTQGAGSAILRQHLSEDDSFLIGPVK